MDVERILILHQGDEPDPGEMHQLVQAFFQGIPGGAPHGVPITTYKGEGALTGDLAMALVRRLEGEGKLKADALVRTTTQSFVTSKGSIVVAGVWRKVPPLRGGPAAGDFEVPGNQKPARRCSDNECPCGSPGALILPGTGYMYIAEEVVEWRRDARSIQESERKPRNCRRRPACRSCSTRTSSPRR